MCSPRECLGNYKIESSSLSGRKVSCRALTIAYLNVCTVCIHAGGNKQFAVVTRDAVSYSANDCRCSVQRRRHARNKNGQFLMLDAASGDTLIACHNAKSYAYDIFRHTALAGEATRLADFNTHLPCFALHCTYLMHYALIKHHSGKHRKDRKHEENDSVPAVLRTSYVTCQLFLPMLCS